MTGDIHPIVAFLLFFSGWVLGAAFRDEWWRLWLRRYLRMRHDDIQAVAPTWDTRKW